VTSNPSAAPEWSAQHLRLAIDAAGVAMWSWHVDSDRIMMDERGFHLWDVPAKPSVVFEELSAKIHPSDRDRVRAAFAATRAIVGPYEIDFRIIAGEEVRWISARGQGDDADMHGRTMYGVFLDVTGRKQAEESNELLAGEMSHRVKNLLTIAAALTTITSRSVETAADMAKELTGRLSALGRAHDLVRPVVGQPDGVLLGDLLTILLAPYDEKGAFSGRIRIAVPRMSVGETSATALAMVLHELATNALKYGCLSVEEGILDVSATVEDDQVVLVWTEQGGPPVVAPTDDLTGFGSGLMARKMTAQLRGSMDREWVAEGLVVTLRMSKERLAA
jgi:two-component sensor histidine kinase